MAHRSPPFPHRQLRALLSRAVSARSGPWQGHRLHRSLGAVPLLKPRHPEGDMRRQRGSRTAIIAMLLVFTAAPTTVAHAQSVDALKQRIEELERSTREQVDALKRMIQQHEAERAQERRAQEERERMLRTLHEQVEQQQLSLQKQQEEVSQALAGMANFFDLKAGAKQTNNGPPPFLGEDIPGDVYSSKDFKIRLGGSLRLHVQHNDTPVGESVSRARVPK